jgi:predicted MFS family arabinose efflux permease
MALALAIAAYLLSFFHRVAPAAIATDLAASFQIGASSLGLLAATYFIIYTLMQIPTGVLADTLGPRRILFFGGLVAGGGSLIFGVAPNFELAFVGRALIGLGVSVTFIAMLKLVAIEFEDHRFATMTGVCMLIGNLGAVLAGAPLAWAVQYTAWRNVFVFVGVLSFLIGMASLFMIDDGSKGRPNIGLPGRAGWWFDLVRVMKNRATWPGFFVNLGMAASFFSFAGLWAVPYFNQVHGMSKEQAAGLVSLYFLGYAMGAWLIGHISDRLGRRKPLLLCGSMLHAAGWWVWWLGVPLPFLACQILCLVMGGLTASFTLTWACSKEVNPPMLSGIATSVVNVGVFLGPAILQPLVGWVMDLSWQSGVRGMHEGVRQYAAADFQAGIGLMAGAAFLGCLASLGVHETGCRNVWKEPNV